MSLNISHEIFPKQIIRRLKLYVPSSADCVCFYLRNFRRHFKLNYEHFKLKHNSIKTSWSHLTSAVCFLCWCGNRTLGLEISKSLTLVPFKDTWHMNNLEQSCLQVEGRLGELLHWKWCVKTLWKQWAVMLIIYNTFNLFIEVIKWKASPTWYTRQNKHMIQKYEFSRCSLMQHISLLFFCSLHMSHALLLASWWRVTFRGGAFSF